MLLEYPSVATVVQTPQLWKLVSQMQRAKCVFWYHEPVSVVPVQRRCMEVSKELPTKMSICKWYKLFSEDGYVCVRKSLSKRQVADTKVNEV
jgi:hypothetical protein